MVDMGDSAAFHPLNQQLLPSQHGMDTALWPIQQLHAIHQSIRTTQQQMYAQRQSVLPIQPTNPPRYDPYHLCPRLLYQLQMLAAQLNIKFDEMTAEYMAWQGQLAANLNGKLQAMVNRGSEFDTELAALCSAVTEVSTFMEGCTSAMQLVEYRSGVLHTPLTHGCMQPDGDRHKTPQLIPAIEVDHQQIDSGHTITTKQAPKDGLPLSVRNEHPTGSIQLVDLLCVADGGTESDLLPQRIPLNSILKPGDDLSLKVDGIGRHDTIYLRYQ